MSGKYHKPVLQTPPLEEVLADINSVLASSNIPPHLMTVDKYRCHGGRFDGRALLRLGGFDSILRTYYIDIVGGNLEAKRSITNNKNYVGALERKLGNWNALRTNVVDGFTEALEKAGKVTVSKLNKPLITTKTSKRRENGVFISDTHLGLFIDPEEVGCNRYDWTIAARRLGKLAEQVATYKSEHRTDCPQLRVLLGGDLGQGIIHLNDAGTDLITYQVIGISKYIIAMLDYWRHYYNKIVVECTPDNHMRLTHKGYDRSNSQKFDSFATMVHTMIQWAFRTCNDVEFHVPKSAITTFDMLGHKMALTHGDTHIKSGNVGHQIQVDKIMNQVLRMNANITDSSPYKAIFMGHVHVPMCLHMQECNTTLITNGTASGTDGYAHGAMGLQSSSAIQTIWETTAGYSVGDWRRVDLGDADGQPKYETIIKPYDHGLMIGKSGIIFNK